MIPLIGSSTVSSDNTTEILSLLKVHRITEPHSDGSAEDCNAVRQSDRLLFLYFPQIFDMYPSAKSLLLDAMLLSLLQMEQQSIGDLDYTDIKIKSGYIAQ